MHGFKLCGSYVMDDGTIFSVFKQMAADNQKGGFLSEVHDRTGKRHYLMCLNTDGTNPVDQWTENLESAS